MKFPCQVKLLETPDETSAHVMTVGNEYTAKSWAGSCLVVTTDVPGETRMVHYGRFCFIVGGVEKDLPITT